MKLLKKYGIYAAIFLLMGLANTYLSERRARDVGLLLLLGMAVYMVARLVRKRKKYRFCPQCGFCTELSWHTEKIDARKKWVRVGRRWHYGGFVTKGTVIHRCPDCGWETDLGK